jgi:hypothetical protein
MVLEKGTENRAAVIAPNWKPILHFDIKPENSRSQEALTIWWQSKVVMEITVLCGEHDPHPIPGGAITEHQRLPIFKVNVPAHKVIHEI